MRRNLPWMYFSVLMTAFALNAEAQTLSRAASLPIEREDTTKVVDYGAGPGKPADTSLPATEAAIAAAVPIGGAGAQIKGVFGQPVSWTLLPLHLVLLPDGRVLSYGNRQNNKLYYDVWNPRLGTGSGAHDLLPNWTTTNIFCAGQSVIPGTGEVVIVGGDQTLNGVVNTGVDRATMFDPATGSLKSIPPMVYERWYPTIVPLNTGDKLILGGRKDSNVYSPTPELFGQDGSWRLLPGATSNAAFGLAGWNWYYPRTYPLPNDGSKLFVLGHNGNMFYVSPAGSGSITQLAQTTLPSQVSLPTAMFAPGRFLSVRGNRKVILVNLNGQQPVVTPTASIDQLRYFANATVLADGKVMVNGGSTVSNKLTGVAYAVELWDPVTGQWTRGASALKPRLYHSSALLMPDATVLTAAGGNPGPVLNLNAEIYYPPYLFDGNGNPAARPTLVAAPVLLSLSATRQFAASVGVGDLISRVTVLHTGSSTHNNNLEQRFQPLPFTQNGQTLQITAPTNVNYTVPGYYMLFVFNRQGVPSVAKIIKIRA